MRKIKEPFADLSQDFRDEIDRLPREEIRQRIAQVTLDQCELMDAQKDDADYQSLKEQFREAGAVYRDGTKTNKLKIKYAKQVLESKGG